MDGPGSQQWTTLPPGGEYKFNPINYELEIDASEGGGFRKNAVDLYMSIASIQGRLSGNSSVIGKEPFWYYSMDRSCYLIL